MTTGNRIPRLQAGGAVKRSVLTVEDLRANSDVDPVTACWHWRGGKSEGQPRIWTLDYERIEKRSMSGPRAVWNIAHQCAPLRGYLVMRACLTTDCVNPVHHKEFATKAEVGAHIARSGALKGKGVAAKLANLEKARAAQGQIQTPVETVLRIRSMSGTTKEIAEALGMKPKTVWKIRAGKSHRHVLQQQAKEAA